MTASCQKKAQRLEKKWTPPEEGELKLNVDASMFPGTNIFSIGMLIRYHQGSFLRERTLRLPAPTSVFEAEAIGVMEVLSWMAMNQLNGVGMQVETDSLLTEHAINLQTLNVLEMGDVIKECYMKRKNMTRITVTFIRRQANKAAHEFARYPCIANNHVDFMFPPSCLVEPFCMIL